MEKVFIDTEFTGLRQGTSLISIGMKSPNGDSFYAESTEYDRSQINSWLQKNVIDKLLFNDKDSFTTSTLNNSGDLVTIVKGDEWTIVEAMRKWFNAVYKTDKGNTVEVWSDCLAYDWVLFCELFGGALNVPKYIYYIPQDICTLFKAAGIDPDINREEFSGYIATEKDKHNALHDANVIEACFNKLQRMFSPLDPNFLTGPQNKIPKLPDITGSTIFIEGPDGAGKSTQIKLLGDYLSDLGYHVIHLRQPGIPGSAGTALRNALFNAGDHLSEFWAKRMVFALEYRELMHRYGNRKDAVILCDRCAITSNIAIGGAEIKDPKLVADKLAPIYEGVKMPDTILVYNLGADTIDCRLKDRKKSGGDMNYYDLKGIDFHRISSDVYRNIENYSGVPSKAVESIDVDFLSVDETHKATIERLKKIYTIEKRTNIEEK